MVAHRIHLLLGATLALLATASAASDRKLLSGQTLTLSGKAIVVTQDREGHAPTRLLAVHTPDGKRTPIQLSDASQAARLHTGMHVEVTGHWEQGQQRTKSAKMAAVAGSAAAAAPRFLASAVRASGAAFAAPHLAVGGATSKLAAASGATKAAAPAYSTNQLVTPTVNTIFVPMSAVASVSGPGVACPGTTLPKFTADQVKQAVFAESNPKGVTVGSTFNKCSYGKTKLTASNSVVAEPVELPCQGTTNEMAWTFSKCDFVDFNGYADAADEVLRARGIDLTQYKYRVYLVPPSACGFVGMGYVGCDGSYECRAWMGADFWATPSAITHELGHNLFLAHAGSLNGAGMFDEYSDASGVMGYCCQERCPNAPHAWQLGWISVQQLDATSLKAGQTVTTTVFSQSTSSRSGLRIMPGWAAGVDPIFVGYRTKAGGDVASASSTVNKVHIYTTSITNTYDPKVTTWQVSLATAGQSWSHPTAGLVVRLTSTTRAAAVVTICRKGGAETAATCRAGIDNDCNGLAGPKDPACGALLRKAAGKGRQQPA